MECIKFTYSDYALYNNIVKFLLKTEYATDDGLFVHPEFGTYEINTTKINYVVISSIENVNLVKITFNFSAPVITPDIFTLDFTVNFINFINFVYLPDDCKESLLVWYESLKNTKYKILEILEEPEIIEVKETVTMDDALAAMNDLEEEKTETDVEVTPIEKPKAKRGRPSVKDVATTIKKIIDLTQQKPYILKAKNDNTRITLAYDRHRENYKVVEDTFEPIGYVEPFQNVIKRGLMPEIASTSPVYGQSFKMETPTQRVRRINKQLKDAQELVNNSNISLEKVKDFQAKVSAELDNLRNQQQAHDNTRKDNNNNG